MAASCGGDGGDPAATTADCPDGARLYELREAATATDPERVTRYCRDAAGLAHGPWRVFARYPDGDPGIPLAEGAYARGTPHGAFIYRFPWATLYAEAATDDPQEPRGDGIQLRQEYLDGLRHGLWREHGPDGEVLAEQHYRYGLRCGTWLYRDVAGGPQETAFADCDEIAAPEPDERPAVAPPGRGASWDGVACPEGERVESDGEVYCERGGRRVGPSLERDGDTEIVGSWVDGVPQGRFIAFLRGRALRSWSYAAGALEGPFARWHPTGAIAEVGAHAAGALDGPWQTWSAAGHLLEDGHYAAGQRDGMFRRLAPGGQPIEEIPWVRGERVGDARTYYDDGAPECQGRYEAGLRQGHWRCLHPTGAVRVEGPYERGNRHGPFRREGLDGRLIAEGDYADGAPHGLWRRYFDADWLAAQEAESGGRVVSLMTYDRGTVRGEAESRWVADDALHSRIAYRDGVRHGLYREWYHSGQLYTEGAIIAELQHGLWRAYYPSGQLALEVSYDLGRLHGPYVEYDAQGQITRQGTYEYDRFIPGGAL